MLHSALWKLGLCASGSPDGVEQADSLDVAYGRLEFVDRPWRQFRTQPQG